MTKKASTSFGKNIVLLWSIIIVQFGLFNAVYWGVRWPEAPFAVWLAELSCAVPQGGEGGGILAQHPLSLYGIVGAGAFLFTLAVTPLCRWLALRIGVIDHPSEHRKVHARTVPYLGGLPFYTCFLGALCFLELFYPHYCLDFFYPMAAGGTLIVLMGLYDDTHDMSSAKKLVVEIVLCLWLYYGGIRAGELAHPFGGYIAVGVLSIVVTPLWIAGVINAVNFSDGLDGLAGGLVFICAASIFAIGLQHNQVVSCVIMMFLMGTTLAFLKYNFNPASIFMGDTGALFLGFVLGTTTLAVEQKGVASVALVVPMVVLAVPILDTLLSFHRRLKRAQSGKFFHPDRHHLHHRLLDLGLSQRQVVLCLYVFSAGMGILAFLLSVIPKHFSFLVLVLAGMATLMGVFVLRFIEGLARPRD